jgi:hypothetical protein
MREGGPSSQVKFNFRTLRAAARVGETPSRVRVGLGERDTDEPSDPAVKAADYWLAQAGPCQ